MVLLFAWTTARAQSEPTSSEVQIQTRATASVQHEVIRVEDVADVTGGDVARRRFISQLDLDEIDRAPGEVQLRQSLIDVRLRLARVNEQEYRITGPAKTLVTRTHNVLKDNVVLDAIRLPLAEAWDVPEDTLHLRLDQPLSRILRGDLPFDSNSRLLPFVPANLRPGKIRLTMGVYQADQLSETFSIPLTVQVEQLAAVARRPIKVGERLSIDNVVFERKRRIGQNATLSVGSHCLGKFAAKAIRTNELVTKIDVVERPPSQEPKTIAPKRLAQPKLIRVPRRSPVSIVAQRGTLRVMVHSAELVADGIVGQPVRVRNLESNRIVAGTLVSPTRVEVAF